jgi:hypothetical protein
LNRSNDVLVLNMARAAAKSRAHMDFAMANV